MSGKKTECPFHLVVFSLDICKSYKGRQTDVYLEDISRGAEGCSRYATEIFLVKGKLILLKN